jgi:hypothetical protein
MGQLANATARLVQTSAEEEQSRVKDLKAVVAPGRRNMSRFNRYSERSGSIQKCYKRCLITSKNIPHLTGTIYNCQLITSSAC